MGQTLTHGVYLPDEGERNCYNGLAANWSILDGAVGTIAEHTSALAGKAPAVHTHTKADITDLFNSANTWSEYNTFTNYIASRESAAIPAGGYGKGVAFQDYQSNRLGYIQPYLTSDNANRLLIGADSGDVAINSSLIPHANNSYNLGTSTNKWKSLNGVNPGALSLPDKPGGSGTVNVNYYDLSGNVTVKDGSTYNSYTALCDGWIVIGSFASEISIEDDTTNLATTAVPKSNGYAQAYLPVRQGDAVRITINQTNTQYQNFKLIPCQGNV